MISSINSRNIIGIDSCDIKVEVDIGKGMPTFNIVGLASTEIKEARERVKSAITNSGYRFPNARIVVNLSPAIRSAQSLSKRVNGFAFNSFGSIFFNIEKPPLKHKILKLL